LRQEVVSPLPATSMAKPKIIAHAVEDAGLTLGSVIRTRVMLTDISRWTEAARAHGEVFATVRPACTFVEVKRFIDPDWLVELEADCVAEHDA
jgi:enamine deaminase RidA (YjgF/YER057c/UK114 family)